MGPPYPLDYVPHPLPAARGQLFSSRHYIYVAPGADPLSNAGSDWCHPFARTVPRSFHSLRTSQKTRPMMDDFIVGALNTNARKVHSDSVTG